MRNFKKILVSLLLSGACAMTLAAAAACGDTTEETPPTGNEQTEHNWSTEWSSDENNHWHACTDSGCTERSDQAAHTYGDWTVTKEATETETGTRTRTCSVCGYVQTETIPVLPHTHVWSDEWSSDNDNHWHACTVEGCEEHGDEAAHSVPDDGWTVVTPATHSEDGLRKGTCTVCDKEVEQVIAKHAVSAEWTYDLNNHWHVCTVDGCQELSDSAAHEYDANGVCTVCGAPRIDSDYLLSLLGNVSQDGVTQMTGTYTHGVVDFRETPYDIDVEYYSDYTYIGTFGSSFKNEFWYTTYEDDGEDVNYSIIRDNYDQILVNSSESEEHSIIGYSFTNVFDTGAPYYGVTEFAYYTLDDALFNRVEVSATMENDAYKYSFNYETYTVSLSFTLSEDNSYITSIEARIDNSADGGTYDIYSFTQSKEAITDGTSLIADPDLVLVTDLTLTTPSGAVMPEGSELGAQTTTIAPGSAQYLNLYRFTNIAPATAEEMTFDDTYITIEKWNIETELWEEDTEGNLMADDWGQGGLNIGTGSAGNVEGTYRLTLSTTRMTKQYLIEIAYSTPTKITATAAGSSSDYNGFTGVNVAIRGSVASGCNPEYTAALTSNPENGATLTALSTGGYTFNATQPGTYVVTVTSSADSNVSDTITLTIAEPPTYNEMLSRTYYAGDGDYESYLGFTVTDETDETITGTLNYYFNLIYASDETSGSYTYTFDKASGTITLTDLPEGYTFDITFTNFVPTQADFYDDYWTFSYWGYDYVVTEDEVPTPGGGGGDEGGETDLSEAILGDWWCESTDVSIYFSTDTSGDYSEDTIYWGAIYMGLDYAHKDCVKYFEWYIDDAGFIQTAPVDAAYAEHFQDNDPNNQLGDYEVGLVATYNSNGTISYGGDTYSKI